jgi:hypothetical protein
MRNRFNLLAAIVALPVATATAQTAAPRNVVSIQPLSAVMTVYSGEFERAVGKAASWGVGATYWNAGDSGDEVTYSSGDFKLRYYPSGAALQGFAFGLSAGYSSVSGKSSTGVDESAGGPSAGILLEYQWLMGTKRNFALGLGAGAKMLMVSEDDVSSSNFTARYPTARVSVGYAF